MRSGGVLIVLSSPSGCGKTTVIRELLNRNPDFRSSVSATTRAPRNGEKNGVHYHFLSKTDFERKIAEGAFYEWAWVHGYYYGTLKEQVDPVLTAGGILLLALDVQGGLHLKERMPDAVLVFLLPPSMDILRQRLAGRGTESPGEMDTRLKNAAHEMNMAGQYDYQIINIRLDDTVRELEHLIHVCQK